MVDLLPLQLGIPGGPELLIILLIAVLLFGANKIPKLARSTGEAMGEFQKGREEVENELQQMREGATGSSDTEEEPADAAPVGAESEAEVETTGDTVDAADADAEADADEDDEFEIADAEEGTTDTDTETERN